MSPFDVAFGLMKNLVAGTQSNDSVIRPAFRGDDYRLMRIARWMVNNGIST